MKSWVTAVIVVVCLAVAAGTGVLLWYFLRPSASPPYVTIELDGSFGNAPQRAAFARVPAGDVFWWWYAGAGDRPVLLVLGGVTDLPASLANLAAIGPNDFNMNLRNDSWVSDYNLLFIDTLGTGFSRVANANSVPKDVDEAAEHLFWALESFYSVYDELSASPLYILGQGHGAQLALALAIRLQNDDASHILNNLQGVALGNAIVSPSTALTQLGFYLEELAYVDGDGRAVVETFSQELEDLIAAEHYGEAFDTFLSLGDIVNENAGAVAVNLRRIVEKLMRGDSSSRDIFGQRNYLAKVLDIDPDLNSIMDEVVGPALGVPGGARYDEGREVLLANFRSSFMIPAVDKVENILQNTNITVTIYNGNLDAISNTPGQLSWVEGLRWPGHAAFLDSPRELLVINRQMEGYFRGSDRLRFYWVNAAGQSVSLDSPIAMRRILRGVAGY